jgi:steroid 5-alpha reductase family enzyme
MFSTYIAALSLILAIALFGWLYSVKKQNVNIVDSLWSLMFLAAALFYLTAPGDINSRSLLVFALVAVWALRLSIHLLVRNWGEAEDHRYQQIRKNNEPNFKFKSLYIIFGLQAVLAWIISVPLLFAVDSGISFHWLDVLALSLWCVGFLFEALGDHQLLAFKRDETNKGKVLDTGLWRYTRHPNYFGEFCMWWAFFLLAIPAGGWWTIYAPLLVTLLLLKVSGVVMMEKDIGERRPKYRDYVQSTNAFFPGMPGSSNGLSIKESQS